MTRPFFEGFEDSTFFIRMKQGEAQGNSLVVKSDMQ